jgi:PKD repeat protein
MKKLIAGTLLVILLAAIAGCSASQKNVKEVVPGITTTTALVTKGAPTVVTATTTAIPPAGSSGYDANTPAPTEDRMIIRNGNMQLVVDDVNAALAQITTLAGTYGGYVVNSNIQENQNRLFGNISIRVLAAHFDDALAALRALAVEVTSESTSGQDVTEEYTDLSAKLRNLEAAEAQLLKLMEQAGSVSDILQVQQELVKTRGEIEQTKGRMQYLEQSSNLALIQVTLEQSKLTVEFTATARTVKEGEKVLFQPNVSGGFAPYSYSWDFGDGQTSTEDRPVHAFRNDGTYTVSLKVTDDRGNTDDLTRDAYITVLAGWQAGNTARSAWNGLVGFGHFVINLIVWLGIFSPVWIVILVILYFTWWRRRKKAK